MAEALHRLCSFFVQERISQALEAASTCLKPMPPSDPAEVRWLLPSMDSAPLKTVLYIFPCAFLFPPARPSNSFIRALKCPPFVLSLDTFFPDSLSALLLSDFVGPVTQVPVLSRPFPGFLGHDVQEMLVKPRGGLTGIPYSEPPCLDSHGSHSNPGRNTNHTAMFFKRCQHS